MTFTEFIRIYPLRAKNIAWFFGAGTSVAAGMPTATDLVWEFKRRIYCSEEGYNIALFKNLTDQSIRNQIQSYFDSKGDYPELNSNEEYSFYFELAFPSPKDRSTYLAQQLAGMENSFGHKVIGLLMKNELVKLIFTTNFDKAFENAAIDQLKVHDRFFVASMDNADTANSQYQSGFRPFIAKVHGDYFSEKLKNTAEELKHQDFLLREILYHACLSNGLAVMGYSGRDASIMEILFKALEQPTSFPNGIFWFVRSGSYILQEVYDFIEFAKRKGIEAAIIEIETFDTAWGDIIKNIPDLPIAEIEELNLNYYRRALNPIPPTGKREPLIRLNAVEITQFPTEARIVQCEVGNTKEVDELVAKQKGEISVVRKKQGVIGFGSDAEFDRVFEGFDLKKDVFQIPAYELDKEDTVFKSLLTEVLARALTIGRPLLYRKKRDRYVVIPDPRKLSDSVFEPLKKALGQNVTGKIPNTEIQWIVGLEISIQRKLSKSFMVIIPTIFTSKVSDESHKALLAPFVKEATARWYNQKYAELLDAWVGIFFEQNEEISISSFEHTMIGYNAKFKLFRRAPFSKAF